MYFEILKCIGILSLRIGCKFQILIFDIKYLMLRLDEKGNDFMTNLSTNVRFRFPLNIRFSSYLKVLVRYFKKNCYAMNRNLINIKSWFKKIGGEKNYGHSLDLVV